MKLDSILKNLPFLKPPARWVVVAAVVSAISVSAATIYYAAQFRRSPAAPQTPNVNAGKSISALGYLRPEGEISHLSVPSALNGSGFSRVGQLFVKEGDKVQAGQVIAALDSLASLQTSLKVALQDVEVANANLAKVQAGAKTGEVEAQKAAISQLVAELEGQLSAQDKTITRLEAELKNAQREYERYRNLHQSGAVNASELEKRQLTMTAAQQQFDEAKVRRDQIAASLEQQIKGAQATLDQISEVRPTDLQAAQAEANRAIAQVAKAQADLELAYIRAPANGQVLKIHTRPGEVVGDKGVVAFGQTDQMNVVAEVYELDVGNVRVGQTAQITSNAFPDKLTGVVTEVGLQVNPQGVVSTDPAADVNRRVVEVKIRLNPTDSQQVSGLTNLQVSVVIDK